MERLVLPSEILELYIKFMGNLITEGNQSMKSADSHFIYKKTPTKT